MQMDLILRKHTLSEQFNSQYLGEFTSLLEVDLSSDQMNAFFSFYESSQSLKAAVKAVVADEEAYPVKFYKKDNISLFGYSVIGFIDIEIFQNRMEPLKEYTTLMNATSKLWTSLGWSISDARIAKIEVGEYNKETLMYAGYPTTFTEIDNLWNHSSY